MTIPLSVFRIVAKIMPQKARDALRQNDIDVEKIRKLAENSEFQGTILQVEDHGKGSCTMISTE